MYYNVTVVKDNTTGSPGLVYPSWNRSLELGDCSRLSCQRKIYISISRTCLLRNGIIYLPSLASPIVVWKEIPKFEEWWGVGLQTVLSRHQVFFRFNEAVVVACFDGLQVGCFFSSQLPAMTIARQEKFNNTIFSFPGRHDISPSLTVLSHWGYNQTTLSWPLRVHKNCQY